MNDRREKHSEQLALFRYGLIADLIHLKKDNPKKLYACLQEKSAIAHCIPGSTRTRVAPETLRNWLSLYRAAGFDGLRPKLRKDLGAARAIPKDVSDLLVSMRDEHRDWSVAMVIEAVRKEHSAAAESALPVSTVHRLLSRAGVMGKEEGEPTSKDRRRFSYERAGELWMSDVMHGPAAFSAERRKRKTYLIGFLDDATRVVPYAAFAFAENTASFLPVLKSAIMRRGIPKRLYVDNGSAFRSQHLGLVCAKLGITLIHARPYQPQGKGKQERFFRTARQQLLTTLSDADVASLDALNRRLWGWIEGEYHYAPHRGLGAGTPLDAWAQHSEDVRMAGPEVDLREMFLFEQKRRVQKDRTVSLDGVCYEVDAVLVGETVTLRYDPSMRGAPIDVWHAGKKVHIARTVDTYANCFIKRQSGSTAAHPVEKNLPASRGKWVITPAGGAPLRMRELARNETNDAMADASATGDAAQKEGV